jgi:hypothetical protein
MLNSNFELLHGLNNFEKFVSLSYLWKVAAAVQNHQVKIRPAQ